MKITLSNIISPVCQEALGQLLTQPVPFKLRLNLAKVQKSVATEIETFDATKIEILKKYCKMDGEELKTNKDGGVTFKSNKAEEEFIKEWNEAITVEVTIDGEQITELDIENVELSVVQGVALSWLIKE